MEDRKSTRLNSSHIKIYTLSLHDALPICIRMIVTGSNLHLLRVEALTSSPPTFGAFSTLKIDGRSEEHTSELQSHQDLHSFPTRRSSDLHTDDRNRKQSSPSPCRSSNIQSAHFRRVQYTKNRW